jgi:hypothetical protein
MSYFSRLAIATRGFRGGAGQSLYISQSVALKENEDFTLGQIVEESVNLATIDTSSLSVAVDQSSGINVAITDDSQTITIDTSTQSISVSTC